jgi:UDPglucose 6-dehydrogenase
MADTRSLRIGVIGAGYLGSVHAACMSEFGHSVVAVDVDAARVAALSEGRPDFFEPGLEDLLAKVLPTGRLRFSTEYGELADAEVVFLCVGTPQVDGGVQANTAYLFEAARRLASFLDENALVVGKSTVPVGTAEKLLAVLDEETRRPCRLAWNPEFLREGHAITDTQLPSRLVYGVEGDSEAEDVALLDRAYARSLEAGVARVVVNRATAELVKGAANSFLATKISFINTIADLCEASGADVVALSHAIGLDDRIGPAFLNAGLGFGGGCLPKDIRAFAARAAELGVMQTSRLLELVDDINVSRRAKVVELAAQVLGGGPLRDRNVAVLGFAFKPGSDDIRDSPALAVATQLAASGAVVKLHDPRAALPEHLLGSMEIAPHVRDAVAGAELVLHMTEWPEYRDLDPADLARLAAAKNLIDARNVLDVAGWEAAGWRVVRLGGSHPVDPTKP